MTKDPGADVYHLEERITWKRFSLLFFRLDSKIYSGAFKSASEYPLKSFVTRTVILYQRLAISEQFLYFEVLEKIIVSRVHNENFWLNP